jgi:hypothetical protein
MDEGKISHPKLTRAIRAVSRWKAVVDIYGIVKDAAEAKLMLEKLEQVMSLVKDEEPRVEISKEKSELFLPVSA